MLPVSTNLPTFNLWFRCGATSRIPWTLESYLFVALLTVCGMTAGFGLTQFVQSTVSLRTRIALLKLAHCLGGLLWLLPFITCNPVTFVGIAINTYLLGAEPYDNVFSSDLWRVVRLQRSRGDTMTQYWAYSSLVVHLWFVGGAAVIALGLEAPAWLFFAIPGFQASHFARLLAYEHLDAYASIAECIGMLNITGCFVVSCIQDSTPLPMVWLGVALCERLTHLPSALRRDAEWMRSYDLWDEAQRSADRIEAEDSENVNGAPIDIENVQVVASTSVIPLRLSIATGSAGPSEGTLRRDGSSSDHNDGIDGMTRSVHIKGSNHV